MGVESEMSITKVKREGKESSTWSTSNSKEYMPLRVCNVSH